MTPDEFIARYEAALALQRWAEVEPLVHPDVCVTFSNGAVHRGRAAVRAAFEENFRRIEGEQYRMTSVHWVLREPEMAVYLFDFEWGGRIDGRPAHGRGRGDGSAHPRRRLAAAGGAFRSGPRAAMTVGPINGKNVYTKTIADFH